MLHSPDAIPGQIVIDVPLYTLFLHENYLAHYDDIDDCAAAMDDMCVADTMLATAYADGPVAVDLEKV